MPGAMAIFKRLSDEPIANDAPAKPLYLGQTYPIHIIAIDSIECAFTPPLVEMEVR